MPNAKLSALFALDDRSARLLVAKCFAPSSIEHSFNLRVCETMEDVWRYKTTSASEIAVTLPRRYGGDIDAVASAIKDMAAALGQPPMFMLIALASGAAIANTCGKMAENSAEVLD